MTFLYSLYKKLLNEQLARHTERHLMVYLIRKRCFFSSCFFMIQDDPSLTVMPRKRPPPWWGVWGWSPPPTRMGTLALLVVLLSQQVLGQQQLNIETQEFSITGRKTFKRKFFYNHIILK